MSDHVENSANEHAGSLGFERIVFFSDAVMAIAITLMALMIPIFIVLRVIFPREHAARRDFEQGVTGG